MRQLAPWGLFLATACAPALLACGGSASSSSEATVKPEPQLADVPLDAWNPPPECAAQTDRVGAEGAAGEASDTADYRAYLERGDRRIFVKSTQVQRFQAPAGMTSMDTLTLGAKRYLLLLSAETGHGRIHRIGTGCALGRGQSCIGEHPVHTYAWGPGWTQAKFFTVADRPYLMRLKAVDGTAHINRINDDGSVGPLVFDNGGAWSPGWTTVTFYRVGGQTFLLLLKAGDGDCHIHQMNADGSVGPMTYDNDARWTSGWTTAQPYTVGGDTFVMLLKDAAPADQALVHIHRVRADGTGTLHPEKMTHRWTPGWTTVSPFAIGDQRYLLLLKARTGKARVRPLRVDGSIGEHVGDSEWSPGWTAAHHYQGPEGRLFRVLLKQATGQVHFDQIHAQQPDVNVHLYQHRGAPDNDLETQNTVEGFANAVMAPATAGLEIDLVFDGTHWRVGHDADFDRYPLFREFIPRVRDAVRRTGKKIMLEIKDYAVTPERFHAIDAVLRENELHDQVHVVSFNGQDQLAVFAENGYRVGLFVHQAPPTNYFLSIEDGLRVVEEYHQTAPSLRATLLLRWAHGALDGPALERLERRIQALKSALNIDLELGFTALPRFKVTAGRDDPRETRALLTQIKSAKLRACNPSPIVVITDHPHAYMSNALNAPAR